MLAALLLLVSSVAAHAAAPEIERVEYEGFGIVDVEFIRDVQYQNPEITILDAQGNAYTSTIWELDDDELTFSVENLNEGEIYSFTISGVRSGFSGEYASVEGEFAVAAKGEVAIKELDYDRSDRELEIEFQGKVQFENPIVEIMDDLGNSYDAQIREMDRDSMELRVSGLEAGRQYRAVVTGVKPEGGDAFGTVSGLFTVR